MNEVKTGGSNSCKVCVRFGGNYNMKNNRQHCRATNWCGNAL